MALATQTPLYVCMFAIANSFLDSRPLREEARLPEHKRHRGSFSEALNSPNPNINAKRLECEVSIQEGLKAHLAPLPASIYVAGAVGVVTVRRPLFLKKFRDLK